MNNVLNAKYLINNFITRKGVIYLELVLVTGRSRQGYGLTPRSSTLAWTT